ncbi:MAG: Clp1/GlmU family protein [Thermodesulfovibrionales bacterium]
MDICPGPEWEGIIENLKKQKGTVFLLGATDSGKSSLAKYLVKKLLKENIRISIVDADVGQSTIGLPGTITMKVFLNEKDMKDLKFDKMFFVGSTNPAKKIAIMVDGSKKMVNLCRKKSEVVIVDTTGLVSGEIGRDLKLQKIRAIRPEHIIAIQKSNELEHIINHIDDIPIQRIKASSMAKPRDRENRLQYRRRKFLIYFDEKEISEFLLNHKDVKFFYNNKQIVLKEGDFKKGTIIGLNHNDDTIGLGEIIEISDGAVFFKSPIKSLNKINKILFSDIEI